MLKGKKFSIRGIEEVMRILTVGVNNQLQQRVNVNLNKFRTSVIGKTPKAQLLAACDSVNFTGLISPEKLKKIKAFIFDLDGTLLEGTPEIREKIFKFVRDENKTLIYSTGRGISKVLPLIEDGTLMTPRYCVCNNGADIYKNIDGKLEEITSWSQAFETQFSKDKVREFMSKISKEYMFSPIEWDKVNQGRVHNSEIESKILEYETYSSPWVIRFMLAPNISKNNLHKIIKKNLREFNINANVDFWAFDKKGVTLETLKNCFDPEIAENIYKNSIPRLREDGGFNSVSISVKTDKGTASEYLRKELKLKHRQILAAGDADNDYSNSNKGYFFILLANATEELKKLIRIFPRPTIVRATKVGNEGIWQAIEPAA